MDCAAGRDSELMLPLRGRSEIRRGILAEDDGVSADVVPNGVEPRPGSLGWLGRRVRALRASVGVSLTACCCLVGATERRKGSDSPSAALDGSATGVVVDAVAPAPSWRCPAGQLLQDDRPNRGGRPRASFLARLDGLMSRRLGTVPEGYTPSWDRLADVLADLLVKEGFGPAVLEAMCAGVPVVTSDLARVRRDLDDGQGRLLARLRTWTASLGALLAALEAIPRFGLTVGLADAVVWSSSPGSARRSCHRRNYDDLSGSPRPPGAEGPRSG